MIGFTVLGVLLCVVGVVYAYRGYSRKCKHRLVNGLAVIAAGIVQFVGVSWWIKGGCVVAVALFIVGVDLVKNLRRRSLPGN